MSEQEKKDEDIRNQKYEYMTEMSNKNVCLLNQAIKLAEDSLERPLELNKLLRAEQKLVDRLNELHQKQSDLARENEILFTSNQQKSVTLQYLEIACAKRAPEVIDIDTSKNGKHAAPPKIRSALEERRSVTATAKTKQQIDEALIEAEHRREALIQARIEANRLRASQTIANLQRIRKEQEEAAMELKRKEYVTQQRFQIQKDQNQKQETDKIAKRREMAEKRKQEYDDYEKRLKEKIEKPKPISEIHAKQRLKLDEMEKKRVQRVQVTKSDETATSLGKKESTTPLKSLAEAKERRENPLKYATPRTIEKAMIPVSARDEDELHEKIVKELQRLKLAAPNEKYARDIEADIQLEISQHRKAMQAFKNSQSGCPASELPKLEFKIDEEDNANKKRKSNKNKTAQSGSLIGFESPFKAETKGRSSRREQLRTGPSTPTVGDIEKEHGPVKKMKGGEEAARAAEVENTPPKQQ